MKYEELRIYSDEELKNYTEEELKNFKMVKDILISDANFLMVRFEKPLELFRYLIARKIILRDRSRVPLCEGCLRITVGTEQENSMLMTALKEYEDQGN